MNPLVRIFVVNLLDDMVYQVGVKKWAVMALFSALIAYATFGGAIIPFVDIAAMVFTVLFSLATVFSIWWKYRGESKNREQKIKQLKQQLRGHQ